MTEVQSNAEQLKQAERVADQLAGYEGIVYDDEFLAHLQEVNQPLLAQFIEARDEGVLKQVDKELEKWEAAAFSREIQAQEPVFKQMLIDNGIEDAKLEIRGAQVEITIPCPGKPLVVRSTSIYHPSQDEWLMDGVAYLPSTTPTWTNPNFVTSLLNGGDWGTLEEVLEDAKYIRLGLARAEPSGDLKSEGLDPFSFNPGNVLCFEGRALHFTDENTFEAENLKSLAKRINERYRIMTGKEAPAAVVAAPVASRTPNAAPVTLSTSAPTAPDSAPAEVVKPIASEAEFYANLKGEALTKLATVSGTAETGSMVIKGFTKGTPEYRYSRINHFFGSKGAAKKIDDPTKYELKVNDKAAEWKVIPGFPDGTLVEKGTETRFLLKEADTKIDWKPLAVATAVPVAPVEVPAAPKYSTERIAELTKSIVDDEGALRIRYLELKERDAALASREKKVEGFFASLAPKKQEQARAEILRERAMLASDYGDYEAELAEYKPYLTDVQAIAFLDSTLPRVDERLAVLRATEVVAPVLASDEAPVTPVTEGKKSGDDGVADAATE